MNKRLNLFFGLILLIATIYFMFWGFDFIKNANKTIFIISVFFGLFMAFNIGGNDVANSFGTSVGAGTLTMVQALLIAAIFEVSGAVLAGSEVTSTIKNDIVNLNKIALMPLDFVYIMMSALISAAIWLLFASKKGLPVSTTHAIVGGIIGASMAIGVMIKTDDLFSIIKWSEILKIAASWVISPLLGCASSYVVYKNIKKYILNYNEIAQIKINKIKSKKKNLRKEHKKFFESLSDIEKLAYQDDLTKDLMVMRDPNYDIDDLESDYYKKIAKLDAKKESLKAHKALEVGIPIIAAFGAFVIFSMIFFKALKNVNLGISKAEIYLLIVMLSATIWMSVFIFAKTQRRSDLSKSTFLMFSWLQVFTAAGFAFSHGSNDIANAVGPFAAIIDTLANNKISLNAPVPFVVMVVFSIALISGLWFIGKRVIETIGINLTKMHPASGFSAELSAASIVIIASILGLPVSSTHILIGSILGIGIVNKQANWALMKPIGLAWIITLPAACVISAISAVALKLIF